MICRLRAECHESDTDISYGVCAACVDVRQNTSGCGVAQTLSILTSPLENWKSGLLEFGLGPASCILEQVDEPFCDLVSAFPALTLGERC